MAFKFALQQLLDFRTNTVRECEKRLEEAYARRDKLRNMLVEERDLYFAERADCTETMRRADFAKVPFLEDSLELRKRRLLEILTVLRDVEGDIEMLEQNMVQVRRDLKVIENLRDRRQGEWLRQEEAKERKLMDEQAMLRHLRREHDGRGDAE